MLLYQQERVQKTIQLGRKKKLRERIGGYKIIRKKGRRLQMGFANKNRREGGKRGQTVREGHPGNLSGTEEHGKGGEEAGDLGAIGETIVEIAQQTKQLVIGQDHAGTEETGAYKSGSTTYGKKEQ